MPRPIGPLLLLALADILAPPSAFADRRELYTELAFAPALVIPHSPLNDAITANSARPALGGQLLVYYGLTNSLHTGVAFAAHYAEDAAFSDATGSTLYENVFALGASAVLAYRLDTGSAWAPVARLEAGATRTSYTRLQVIYQGFATPLADTTETAFAAAASLATEYRASDHFVFALGITTRRTFGRLGWAIALPLSAGIIW